MKIVVRGRTNWFGVHKGLWEKHGITPEQVGHFTIPEIELAMADPKNVTPTGHPNLQTDWDVAAELAAWERMTPLEKVRSYQR